MENTRNSFTRGAAIAFAIVLAVVFTILTINAGAPSALAASGKSGVWDVPGRHVSHVFHPGAASATATSSEIVFEALAPCRIKRVAFIPSAAFTGDNTNYFSLDVINRGTDGSGTTSILSAAKDFTTGVDGTAGDAIDLSLSSTDATIKLAVNQVLAIKRTKTASGLLMPSGLIVIEFEPA